ncbi:lytic transglycosylase domain-containing protein [Phenylobacterium sp.]|uniref:lytic transglycosylase domain-containing protein n=1 Tax=Phenylobacterium sp. TaxID=1871053 RepID=UPI002DE7554D|nr:lytic transglycosylase domain-containing protein [Phenylobacterium sp.]
MNAKARKILLIAGSVLVASAAARAQPVDPIADLLQSAPPEAPVEAAAVVHSGSATLSASDVQLLRRAIDSGRRGDVNGARAARDGLTDPLARQVASWVLADSDGDSLGFAEIDNSRRQLADWPHATRWRLAAERLIETSGKPPQQIVDWFSDNDPQTPQGAMALAGAERMLGKPQAATTLIKHWWRDKSFDSDAQRTMLSRFGDVLTPDDHVRRVDIALYNPNTAAARDLLPLIPADQLQAAEARLAFRANAANAGELASALPASVANSPGVVFEHAAYLRRHNLDGLALALVKDFPHEIVTPEQAKAVWEERRHLILTALKAGDTHAAYAAADSGIGFGSEATDAEFYAGWLALTKLGEPEVAAKHFATIDRVGVSPITRARALYWEGRAAEARHDKAAADGFYEAAAVHNTTFYGELAGEKVGAKLVLTADPEITPADRVRFEGRPAVQAARLLYEMGYRDLYRTFVLSLDDLLPSRQDEALLIDLVRGNNDQYLSMLVARSAAQHGYILTDRAYPYRTLPQVDGAPEPALVLAITRQESGFDPGVHSATGARGMMQIEPSTGAWVARKLGVSYSASQLYEPDYNMRLGAHFLGKLVDQFSGSYALAAAAYNAGPARPPQWVAYCGDPRSGSADPVDFIECIPFSETRNYVMRVMENVQVYRAKMNGGTVPITLSGDLKRGGYGYRVGPAVTANLQPVSAAAANAPTTPPVSSN